MNSTLESSGGYSVENRTFAYIMSVLGRDNRLLHPTLRVNKLNCGEVCLSALRVFGESQQPPGPNAVVSNLPPMFSSLTKLELALRNPGQGHADVSIAAYLPGFLSTMPNLRKLNLTFPSPHEQTGATLYGEPGFAALAQLPAFEHLTHLGLVNMHFRTPAALKTLLAKHAGTLRDLTIIQMSMLAHEWIPLVQFIGRTLELEQFRYWGKATKFATSEIAEQFVVPIETWKRAAKNVYGLEMGKETPV